MKAEDYGYVVKNNICGFMRGPLSNWYGSFKDQIGGFEIEVYQFPIWNEENEVWNYMTNEYENIQFNCVEQWMMAGKAFYMDDLDTFIKIMAEPVASVQKSLGRSVKNFDNDIWKEVRYDYVKEGITHKFEQNFHLENFLRSFDRNTLFVEANKSDPVWSCGLSIDDPLILDIHNWRGENLLGEITREVRRNLD